MIARASRCNQSAMAFRSVKPPEINVPEEMLHAGEAESTRTLPGNRNTAGDRVGWTCGRSARRALFEGDCADVYRDDVNGLAGGSPGGCVPAQPPFSRPSGFGQSRRQRCDTRPAERSSSCASDASPNSLSHRGALPAHGRDVPGLLRIHRAVVPLAPERTPVSVSSPALLPDESSQCRCASLSISSAHPAERESSSASLVRGGGDCHRCRLHLCQRLHPPWLELAANRSPVPVSKLPRDSGFRHGGVERWVCRQAASPTLVRNDERRFGSGL